MSPRTIILAILATVVVGCEELPGAKQQEQYNNCGYHDSSDIEQGDSEVTAGELLAVMDNEFDLNGEACLDLCETVGFEATTNCEVEIDDDFDFDDSSVDEDEVVATVECYFIEACG
ncbi:MAG: hypothetical protein HN348_08545 [Proteobacteria bacterium]|jgi:hypothetical protein|nr:hypothetical protein [Pseudomonadota bacterium]